MTPLETFFWGFAGSLAVEVVNVNQAFTSRRSALPRRYRQPAFWVWRVLLAVVGGGLAVAYGITDNRILAANIGVATPLIIQALARGLKVSSSRLPQSLPGTGDDAED